MTVEVILQKQPRFVTDIVFAVPNLYVFIPFCIIPQVGQPAGVTTDAPRPVGL